MSEDKKRARSAFMLSVASLPVVTLVRAWSLMQLWGWFVVPLGLPAVGLWHAAGVSIVAAFLTAHATKEQADEGADAVVKAGRRIFNALLWSAFAVAFGWLNLLLWEATGW